MATFLCNGAISRPATSNQQLIEHRAMGGLSFDVRWGVFIPFSDEVVAYQEPHPGEVSNGSTPNLPNTGSA